MVVYAIITKGDIMQGDKLELFYDVLDESINFLYEQTHKNYLELIMMTSQNILAGEVLNDLDEEAIQKLEKIYKSLENIDFGVEEVRKALQAIILKGFKEVRVSNGATTPDTLGIFIAYLISRFNDSENKKINILDPLCGTGNLLFSISNHLDLEVMLYGCDHNETMIQLTKLSADLLNQPIELFFQDALTLRLKEMDFITFDMPTCEIENGMYFPYEMVLRQALALKDDGYMFAIMPTNFFDFDKESKFKEAMLELLSIVGIIELPDSMFISNPKSIIIFKRAMVDSKKCLLVKLPSFKDAKELNKSLVQIETWFENNFKK